MLAFHKSKECTPVSRNCKIFPRARTRALTQFFRNKFGIRAGPLSLAGLTAFSDWHTPAVSLAADVRYVLV